MQQSGDADVRILTENLYKFVVLGGYKLIREFSDKGCKYAFKEVATFWFNEKTNEKRPTSLCAF